MLIELLSLAAVAYGSYLAFGFAMQRRMMYPAPTPPPYDALVNTDGERLWAEGDDFRSELWLLPPTTVEGPAPLLVFTHGNGELIDYWVDEFGPARDWGFAVLLVEYPGYGRSTGSPSERTITGAMVAAYDLVASRPDVDERRIVGYGRSLGGAAIGALSRQRDFAAIVLESAFTSVAAMARTMGYPGFLVRDRFDNEAALEAYDGPVLILHGRRDRIIPPSHADALSEAASDARLVWMECGHNDCPRPWSAISDFLGECGLRGD